MNATFLTVSKRINSTLQPGTAGGWETDVKLKDSTDLVTPTLFINNPATISDISRYNYVTFGGRYYFINSWESVRNDLWRAHCSLDIMSTYKDSILSTTAFVEYDTTENSELVDNRLAHVTTATVVSRTAIFSPNYSSAGSYILTVTGRGGSVSSYRLSLSSLSQLLNSVQNWANNIFNGVETTADSVAKMGAQLISVGNASSNIRSCTWVPWTDIGATSSDEIYLGNYGTGVNGDKLLSPVGTYSVDLEVPWQYGDWRNSSSNTNVGLFLPYVGNVALDATMLKGYSHIKVIYGVDRRTGAIAYTICDADEVAMFGSYGGSAGATIPVGVSNISPMSILNSITTAVASFTGAAPFVAGLASAAQNLLVPNVTCVGGIGSAAGSGASNVFIAIWTNCHNTNVSPNDVSAVMGTPTMQTKSLAGLSGFVKTRGASVGAPCGDNILSRINDILDGGCYLE